MRSAVYFLALLSMSCADSDTIEGDYGSTGLRLVPACFIEGVKEPPCSAKAALRVKEIPKGWRFVEMYGDRAVLLFDVPKGTGEGAVRLRVFFRIGEELYAVRDSYYFSKEAIAYRKAKHSKAADTYPDIPGYIKYSDGTEYYAVPGNPGGKLTNFQIQYYDERNQIYCRSYGSTRVFCNWGETGEFSTSFDRLNHRELRDGIAAVQQLAIEGLLNAQ